MKTNGIIMSITPIQSPIPYGFLTPNEQGPGTFVSPPPPIMPLGGHNASPPEENAGQLPVMHRLFPTGGLPITNEALQASLLALPIIFQPLNQNPNNRIHIIQDLTDDESEEEIDHTADNESLTETLTIIFKRANLEVSVLLEELNDKRRRLNQP